MAYIGQDPVIGRYIIVDQISGGFNGTASGFTLAAGGQGVIPGLAQNVLLSLGGVIQQPGTDYTVSGSGITFTTPPLSGTTFFATVLGDVQAVGTPSDGTVLPASIATSGTFVFPNITTTGTTLIASGNASTPSLAVIGDTNTGLYSPGADQLAISTAGSGRLFVDATGNVGVGAVSDAGASKLFIAGNGTAGLTNIVTIRTASSNSYGLQIKGNDTNAEWLIQNYYSAALAFGTSNTERLRITAGGLVGVGTSAPGYKFEVDNVGGSTATARLVGNDQANVRLRIQNIGSGGRAYEIVGGLNGVNNSHLSVYDATAAATRLTITDTGLVGIGTSSPTLKLSVDGDTWFGNGAGVEIGRLFNDSGVLHLRGSANVTGLALGTNNTRAVTIDSSGRVGIGTTSVSRLLHISAASGDTAARIQTATSGAFLEFQDSATTAGRQPLIGAIGDNLVFYTSAGSYSERARIDSSGRLLVGTTTALGTSTLVVQGIPSVTNPGIYLSRASNASTIVDGNTLGFIEYGSQDNGLGAQIVAVADGTWSSTSDCPTRLVFSTTADGAANPTERLRIDSSGRLGIGTTSPNQLLQVNSSSVDARIQLSNSASGSTNSDGFMLQWNNNDIFFDNKESGNFIFQSGANEAARIDSSRRLLVGTSTSRSFNTHAGALQIDGDTYSESTVAIVNNSNTSDGAYLFFVKQRSGSAGGSTVVQNNDIIGEIRFNSGDGTDCESLSGQIQCLVDGTPGSNDVPGRLVFSTTTDGSASPTERMRINRSGELAMMCNANNYNLFISNASTAGTTFRLIDGRYGSQTAYSGTTSFIVYTNGNVQNTNNSYGALSDIKLKENVVDANSQWDDLKSLQVRNYNFKEGQTHTQIGLIAQEVELVSPGLVSESPDRDEDGNDLGTVTKSVNYSVLYMKAIKALQEAMERIEATGSQSSCQLESA
jgi:hypothetical protein